MPLTQAGKDYPRKVTEKFDTVLSPQEETAFQAWAAQASKAIGRDILMDTYDYDVRGYWLSRKGKPITKAEHGPDTYKKPWHPTFSDESIYNGATDPNTGAKYQGGKWTGDDKKGWYFVAGPTNLELYGKNALIRYFEKREPDVKLVIGGDTLR